MDPRDPLARLLNRRAFVGGSLVGLAGLALAGCGGGDKAAPSASGAGAGEAAGPGLWPPGPPSAGGTGGGRIVVGYLNEGNSNDPAIGYTETSWDSICNLTFSPLYTYGADGATPEPNAAAAMPEVSEDGLVYTIPLRAGVTFHNGRAVIAADYQYALDRTLDPKLESWAASYLFTIVGAQERYEGKATEVSGIRVIDDLTLEVTLVQPDVTFLYSLTQPFTAPVPREEVERLGDEFAVLPVGNGPYRIVSWDSAGQKALFTRYEGHFWPPLPYVEEVEMQWGLDASVQLLKMKRGEVDALYSGFTPDQLVRVSTDDELKGFLYAHPLYSCRWVNLHPRAKAFANADVRRALNWATDREQLGRIVGAESSPWGAPYPIGFGEKTRTFEPYTYDPEKARALLAASGVTDLTATLYVSDSPEPQIGQVLQQQWQDVGFDLKLKQIGVDASYELSLAGKLDAWFSTFYAIYPTAIDVLQYYESTGSSNYTGYASPEVDRLTAEARRTSDETARNTLLSQVEQLLGDDAVHVFLQNVNWLMGVNQERLHNFAYSGVYGAYYDRLWVES